MPTRYYREFENYLMYCRDHPDNHTIGGELCGIKRDGAEFPIELSISEISFDQVKKFVLLIRDLSSQREAEKQVREQRELLAHVDRLNTMGEMAAGIAHEINQPLTAISMYAQTGIRLMQNQKLDQTLLMEALDKLSNQAHRAGNRGT